jgi:branched-chain amino acid transport system substrate-binding protein
LGKFKFLALPMAALLVAAGCTSGDEETTDADGGGGGSTTTADPEEAQRAPGVTDDTIKVGITYPDLDALGDAINVDHGDYEAVYAAVIDDINARGGVGGRQIEPVFAPVNPAGTEPAEEACLRLTEDEQVFVAMGFFFSEAPLCYLETHDTAVIGGQMNPTRLERAAAPWFTSEAGSDLQTDVVQALADAGELDGELALFAQASDEAALRDLVEPQLEELGIEPVDVGINDADGTDIPAADAATATIAERFESAGVTQVLATADSALTWLRGLAGTDYRPQTLLITTNTAAAYALEASGPDLSVLEGAVAGDVYGPGERRFEAETMQDCLGAVEAAGIEVENPADVEPGEPDVFAAVTSACSNLAIFDALVTEAGEDLNYASFRAAADGLEVTIPGHPEPARYGPPPHADGDLSVYLYDFDADADSFFVPREG